MVDPVKWKRNQDVSPPDERSLYIRVRSSETECVNGRLTVKSLSRWAEPVLNNYTHYLTEPKFCRLLAYEGRDFSALVLFLLLLLLFYSLKCLATDTINSPPLWSGGQSSSLQIQRFRVQFPVLADVLRSSGSGTGYTQPRENNCGSTCKKK
jgi:hypothetical protein